MSVVHSLGAVGANLRLSRACHEQALARRMGFTLGLARPTRRFNPASPQPLTDPLAMPSMKRRCISRKKTRTGATMRIAAAMISPQSLLYWPPSV
jgi:hypothetical protein